MWCNPLLRESISDAHILVPFEPDENAVLAPLRIGNSETIPCIPGFESQPCLLLHDLKNERHKNNEVYRYIDDNKYSAITMLYGTSGAGKTRSILEYLASNKGVYLVGGRSAQTVDPGSFDVEALLHSLKIIHELQGDEKRTWSEINYAKVLARIRAILYIRHEVYTAVNAELASSSCSSLTPYQWLLLQMYPNYYFGGDVFNDVLNACMNTIEEHGVKEQLLNDASVNWDAIVMDESQQLLNKGRMYFCSSSVSLEARTLYSAVLNAFLDIKVTTADSRRTGAKWPFPTFSGTGMSIQLLTKESDSASAKRNMMTKVPAFVNFQQLQAENVEAYLAYFLNFDNVDAPLTKHIAQWLVGRPRWTATFIEEFLVRGYSYKRHYDGATRASFTRDAEKRILQAVDKYINDMTASEEDRRDSWAGGNKTPYACISNFMSIRPSGQLTLASPESNLERAIFKYAVGKEGTTLSEDAKDLIQLGVACLDVKSISQKNTHYNAIISEPLVIAAGLKYFGLMGMARNGLHSQNKHGHGIAFESCCISPLCEKLSSMLTEFTEMKPFDLSAKSSYGVVLRNCNTGEETMEWIEQATAATFEGTVEPFCSPDDNMGADLLSLLWNSSYTDYRPLLAQAKFEMDTVWEKALETLVRKWFWMQKRNTADAKLKYTNPELVKRCEAANKKIAPDDKSCVRLLIAFPATFDVESKFEKCHKDSCFPCRATDCECLPPCDFLRTIDGTACEAFFDNDTYHHMIGIKGPPLKRQKKAKTEKRNNNK